MDKHDEICSPARKLVLTFEHLEIPVFEEGYTTSLNTNAHCRLQLQDGAEQLQTPHSHGDVQKVMTADTLTNISAIERQRAERAAKV